MTLPLRRVVFWLHLSAGVLAAIVVLVMSVTGVVLAYEKQMIRWLDGYSASPAPGQDRLPLDTLVARAVAERPAAAAASIVVRRDPAAPVEISAGREGSLFLDPYTGQVLGTGSARTRAFFRSTMEWHRWLAMKDASRATGKMITGVSNLVFLVGQRDRLPVGERPHLPDGRRDAAGAGPGRTAAPRRSTWRRTSG